MTPSLDQAARQTSGSASSSGLCLVLDSSLQGVSMAIADFAQPAGAGVSLLWTESYLNNMGSNEAIAALLTRGLLSVGCTLSDLSALVVSPGPGTFTGIKVGLAFAYGLRSGVQLRSETSRPFPCLAISSLEAAVHRLAPSTDLFLPATRTHGYLATSSSPRVPARLFDCSDEISVANYVNSLEKNKNELAIFERWPLLTAKLEQAGVGFRLLPASEVCATAIYGMAEEAAKVWPTGFKDHNPEPRYLRLSTAEERLRTGPQS